MRTQQSRVEVFLGDAIAYLSEREFLARLRADLERCDVSARIFANFMTMRGGQRQVDFLIATEHRLVHAELKSVDQALPVVGRLNSRWAQVLPGGTVREHERNYFRQAQETTYAINDDMRDLFRSGEVPGPTSQKFFKDIHTVVCLYPEIPAGSEIDKHEHVDVVGYRELVELLAAAGPRPSWSDEHFEAFARHLGLMPERPDDERSSQRRASVEALEDYRRRFVAGARRGLSPYIPIAVVCGSAVVDDPRVLLTEAATTRGTVLFTGPSGAGKSHAMRWSAIALAEAGIVSVWVNCKEYISGQLSTTLSRAVAPYTTEGCLALLGRAVEIGADVLLVLDGLNEVGPDVREVLLRQVDALRLRVPVALVVTSTAPAGIGETTVTVTAQAPDSDTRTALLAAYGRGSLAGLEAFSTPLELAMAAECAEELRPGATSTELFDAYISARCRAETTRAGLRRLAIAMDEQLRSSLTVPEVRALLHHDAVSEIPDGDIDAVLSSPLLAPAQGRVSFTHDLFGRFLTAEQLVLDAPNIRALADQLDRPHRQDLWRDAVALEHDGAGARELLLAIPRLDLVVDAARGAFGDSVARLMRAEITGALAEAVVSTGEAVFVRNTGEPDDVWDGKWTVPTPRSAVQQTLLQTAGVCLADGLFVEEVGHLLEVTDTLCLNQMRQLRAAGHRYAVTNVIRATYGGFTYAPDVELAKLPASVVVDCCDHWRWRRDRALPDSSPAQRLWDTIATPHKAWGQLTATLLLLETRRQKDMELMPDVVAAAWAAGGYHTRLAALTAAHDNSGGADEAVAARMREVLDGLGFDNIMLNGLHFEALAAYGGLEPLNTAEGIEQQIRDVLAAGESPEAWTGAHGIVSMIFEDEAIHGPYGQVLSELDDASALRLYTMAARSGPNPFHHDWLMANIVERIDHADEAAREVVAVSALNIDWDSPFRQETITAHLIALRGWAQLAEELPSADIPSADVPRGAWRLVDELLFHMFKDRDPDADQARRLWGKLLDLYLPATADVLAHVRSAEGMGYAVLGRRGPYQQLLETWPAQCRQVFEWGIVHRDRVVSGFKHGPLTEGIGHALEGLGLVGDQATLALLQDWIDNADIGVGAVSAIRAIRQRLST